MNFLLIQTILAAQNNEGEDTFWMQMLVLVILAASFGIFSIVKAKANKIKRYNQPPSQHHRRRPIQPVKLSAHNELSSSDRTTASKINKQTKFVDKLFKDMPGEGERDLHSGMEILGQDFLLSIVESANGNADDTKDVAIRELNFKELLRRGKLNQADSLALKTYAVNKGNIYGKDIQCEAIKTLAERTAKSKN